MIMKGIQYVELKDIFILCQMSDLIKIALSAHQRHQQPTKQFSLPGVRGSYPIGLNYRPII
jgi:hypothetical protein